jgi:hypothetical protein
MAGHRGARAPHRDGDPFPCTYRQDARPDPAEDFALHRRRGDRLY